MIIYIYIHHLPPIYHRVPRKTPIRSPMMAFPVIFRNPIRETWHLAVHYATQTSPTNVRPKGRDDSHNPGRQPVFFSDKKSTTSRVFSGTPKDMGPLYGKFPILFPYLYGFWTGSGMGIIWETSHKGVPLLGVPESPTDNISGQK